MDKKTESSVDLTCTLHTDRTGAPPMSPDLPVQSSSSYFKALCQKSEDIGAAALVESGETIPAPRVDITN